MNINVTFEESACNLRADFQQVTNVSDGGFERGYSAGYDAGESDGRAAGYAEGQSKGYAEGAVAGREAGYAEGLAARKYETWTITLVDGSVVEKEVALL